MARVYEVPAKVASAIAALPSLDGHLAVPNDDFWLLVAPEQGRDVVLPEVLAYLVRMAYAGGYRTTAERLFEVLWDRYSGHVVFYTREYSARLQRGVTVDDVVVDVFATLARRLRAADGPTFYEACFLGGIKRLALDKVQRMGDEPLVSLTVSFDEGDEEEQRDLPDPDAVDPEEYGEVREQQATLHATLPAQLNGLPSRVQQTAWLLMRGKSDGQIADLLGVSTRMVTNYKKALREALAGFG